MVYTILISIVFIAEIIIAITIIQFLIKLDRKVIEYDEIITSTKPGIKEISILSRKISEQIVEIVEEKIRKFKKDKEEALYSYISKVLIGLFALKLNIKFINNFRKSKVTKILAKGLSLLEIMV